MPNQSILMMAYIEILIAFFFIVFLCYSFRNKNGIPTNWPFFGMLPGVLINLHDYDYFTKTIEKTNLTFSFKGPWFTDMHKILATVDPSNVHYIMSKNFGNYPKGSKFKEIFNVLGDGIFNADFHLWQYHRKMAQSYIGHPDFHQFLVKKVWEKIDEGLIPVLNHVAKQGLEIDLHDLFERFTFDTICYLLMDYDPNSLSIDFPSVPASKALDDVEEAMFYRHAIPACIWKFQGWLGVGFEKKHQKAWKILYDFIYKCISRKREEMRKRLPNENKSNKLVRVDLMTLYMDGNKSNGIEKDDDKFYRDTFLNFFVAGRDTTSIALAWFFYLLSTNPRVVLKIREEIALMNTQVQSNNYNEHSNYLSRNNVDFIDKLVYLHASICEALRLYPPLAFQSKSTIESDILPSGHSVDPNTQIIFNLYAMARIKSIWGEDCCEFKPERWISPTGKIRHEPSYKFFAFNAGPRTCVGKNMAFIQMKAIAVTIIKNYNIQAVEGHHVIPKFSIILHMKNGFKVKVLPM